MNAAMISGPALADRVDFLHGAPMKNRFMLAPLTNQQSHVDGSLSEDELHWLIMRAQGGFAMTMTCAAHVQAAGQGFEGQLGCYATSHLDGLTRLARSIHDHNSLAIVQLHHAGRRSPTALTGHAPVAPSADESLGARALSLAEVEEVIDAFAEGAMRAQIAGFDGIEIHGAHDYLLCEFLNTELNHREDRFGGDATNRSRIFFEIIDEIRRRCDPNFFVGVRLSPERFGMRTVDILNLYDALISRGDVDMIDLSLWDCFKNSSDEQFEDRPLLELFSSRPRFDTRLAVAGKIYSASDAQVIIDRGADIVAIGRGAVTNHDFAQQALDNASFQMRELPVSRDVLRAEGLGPALIEYMSGWKGFVAD
jgi:2,4-dienoyl-CoA reductase-like NADH-dependent reductase (Old Yellow Enzyme family)